LAGYASNRCITVTGGFPTASGELSHRREGVAEFGFETAYALRMGCFLFANENSNTIIEG